MSAGTLGPYRLERELGRGGLAVVYLAEDTRLARRLALKVFSPELENGSWLEQKIRREVDLAARLSHPGICAIHDAGSVDGRAYIAMRYVEGESLARWLERAHPLAEKLALLEDVARTVQRAHELGVVHGDLKPSNVMVPPDGIPVLLDFGSARDAAGPAPDGAGFSGTPAYAAPEQIQSDQALPDRRSDVFALGVMLYEALTGKRPFQGSNPESVFRAVLSHAPPSPRDLNPVVSRDLEAVVLTALAKVQDERYQTALDLAEDLRRVRAGETISIRRAGLWTRYRRWARRRPAVAGALSLLTLALAVGIGYSARFLHQDRRALAKVRLLSDSRALSNLVQREKDEAWPDLARGVPAMDAWLREATTLLARGVAYAADEDPESVAFVHELDTFRTLSEEVGERRAQADTLAARTIAAHQGEWEQVIAAIADARANPTYCGLRIAPQEGLVPLGRDPDSHLYEFGHPQSGVVPERDPATGKLRVGAESGLVFVLLPGGVFRMGAVRPDAEHPLGAPNVDPDALANEAPVHEVALDPFLLSKYEMSVAQWVRLGGTVPVQSWRPAGATDEYWQAQLERSPTLPIGAALDAMSRLQRLGLTLPTEAQMEYATRAGTSTVWWTGNEFASLRELEHVEGKSGFAPVFEGSPNPFGLLQVHGNILEQVLDWFGSYELPVRPGDGLRLVEKESHHVHRGGSTGLVSRTRSAYRGTFEGGGLRPARALDPSGR